jgi:hypothetical protein
MAGAQYPSHDRGKVIGSGTPGSMKNSDGDYLFSPVNFPVECLPNWLEAIHHFLPVKCAAIAMRGALVPGYSDGPGLALAVLGVWCLAGLVINYMVATHRG